MSTAATAYRSSFFHCLADPGPHANDRAVEYLEDGLLVVNNGRVEVLGDAGELLPGLSKHIEQVDLRDKLIVPGFVDCHVHYPQVDIIASYGEQLLDWLNKYAYPVERRFADAEHAREVADFFTDELLRNGTTTAMVFATVHPISVDAIFEAAQKRNMRLIAGKVLMDRNCPEELRDSAESGYSDSKALIEKWHGTARLSYAITPRFAVTSSGEQLAAAGRLASEYPDVFVHTHLAESAQEVELIARYFPSSRSYLDVYDQHKLVREHSVFAHSLHLDDMDRSTMAAKGASIAFCPTSNLFLGSGLFDLRSARDANIKTGIGSDVGGGTSLSQLRTLSEAYKVLQLQGQSLPAFAAFYLATLGGAEALGLDDRIGNFERGKEADFVVLDSAPASITRRRLAATDDVAEKLFALMMLGDDRAVFATYLAGRQAYSAWAGPIKGSRPDPVV
jgi:guanine deaminase